MDSERNDELLARDLSKFAEEAHQDLLAALPRSTLPQLCYAQRSRVKSHRKLLEKVSRKRPKDLDYQLETITDVIGLRLVTLFRDDIPLVVLELLKLLKGENFSPNPFINTLPEEIIIYSVHKNYDALDEKVSAVVLEQMPECASTLRTEQSEQGYSSIHIIARLCWSTKNGGINDVTPSDIAVFDRPDKPYHIPLEIQIRTVFEDAWGEIDHKYGYVHRQDKEHERHITNPQFVSSHLRVLKRFVDACSQYADVINEEANSDTPHLEAGNVFSVGPDNELIERFKALGVEAPLCEEYARGRDKKERALAIDKTDIKKRRPALLDAAESFRDLGDLIAKPLHNSDSKQDGLDLIYFYSKLNEAFCLLSTYQKQELLQAKSIYEDLEGDYRGYVFLSMRLGQVLGKLGQPNASLRKLLQAEKMAEKIFSETNGQLNDQLPRSDYEYMRRTLPFQIGFQYWRKAEELDRSEKNTPIIADYLKKAYSYTEQMLNAPDVDENKKLLTHQNQLYYAVEYLKLDTILDKDFTKKASTSLPIHLKYVEDDKNPAECTDLEILDTLMITHNYLDEPDIAKQIAERIIRVGLLRESHHLDKSLRIEILENAQEFLEELNNRKNE